MNEPDASNKNERHHTRMVRKKQVVDAAIAAAQDERGVLLVNTGNGKGKSSAAFGLVAAVRHGLARVRRTRAATPPVLDR